MLWGKMGGYDLELLEAAMGVVSARVARHSRRA
jgi:hypothetical protein